MRIAGAATSAKDIVPYFSERGDPRIGRGRYDRALDPNRILPP